MRLATRPLAPLSLLLVAAIAQCGDSLSPEEPAEEAPAYARVTRDGLDGVVAEGLPARLSDGRYALWLDADAARPYPLVWFVDCTRYDAWGFDPSDDGDLEEIRGQLGDDAVPLRSDSVVDLDLDGAMRVLCAEPEVTVTTAVAPATPPASASAAAGATTSGEGSHPATAPARGPVALAVQRVAGLPRALIEGAAAESGRAFLGARRQHSETSAARVAALDGLRACHTLVECGPASRQTRGDCLCGDRGGPLRVERYDDLDGGGLAVVWHPLPASLADADGWGHTTAARAPGEHGAVALAPGCGLYPDECESPLVALYGGRGAALRPLPLAAKHDVAFEQMVADAVAFSADGRVVYHAGRWLSADCSWEAQASRLLRVDLESGRVKELGGYVDPWERSDVMYGETVYLPELIPY